MMVISEEKMKLNVKKIVALALSICIVLNNAPVHAISAEGKNIHKSNDTEILYDFGFPAEIVEIMPKNDIKEIAQLIQVEPEKVGIDITYMEVDALSQLEGLICMSEDEISQYGVSAEKAKCVKDELDKMKKMTNSELKVHLGCDDIEAKMIKTVFEEVAQGKETKKLFRGKSVTSAGEISTSKMTFIQNYTNNSTTQRPNYTIRMGYNWTDSFWWDCFDDKIVAVWGGNLATSNIQTMANYISGNVTYTTGIWDYEETTINGALQFTSPQSKEVSTGTGMNVVTAHNDVGYCKFTLSQSKKQGYKTKVKGQYFHKRIGVVSSTSLSVASSGTSAGVTIKIIGMYDHSDAKYSDITY